MPYAVYEFLQPKNDILKSQDNQIEIPPALFIALERVIWHANHHPYQPHFAAYHPVFGPTSGDRESAILRSAARKWKAHCEDPSSRWIYVALQDEGHFAGEVIIVGGCQWKTYFENPYAGGGPIAAYDPSMWPERSEGRRFVEMMMQKQYAHRKRWMRRPHVVCQQMAIHPHHRGKGLGSLLMDWGVAIAQRGNLELFLHSTSIARRLYERHGLRVVQKVDIDMEVRNPSDEWQKLMHELGPLRFFIMWKPAEGIYEEGRTTLPWEVEA